MRSCPGKGLVQLLGPVLLPLGDLGSRLCPELGELHLHFQGPSTDPGPARGGAHSVSHSASSRSCLTLYHNRLSWLRWHGLPHCAMPAAMPAVSPGSTAIPEGPRVRTRARACGGHVLSVGVERLPGGGWAATSPQKRKPSGMDTLERPESAADPWTPGPAVGVTQPLGSQLTPEETAVDDGTILWRTWVRVDGPWKCG